MLTIAQVKELQALLNAKGQSVVVDGDLGAKTEEAIYAVLVGKVPEPNPPVVVVPKNPTRWPAQSEVDAFYGNPRGRDGNVSPTWYAANIIKIIPPYKIWMGDIPITKIPVHRKCAESALRVLNAAWEKIGKDQVTADKLGMSKFSGSFNYRVIRGGSELSMHAYGCAWDWDAGENQMGDDTPFFTADHPFAVAHAAESWEWGGLWRGRKDAMHFQCARTS